EDRWLWGLSNYDAPIASNWLAQNKAPIFLHYYVADTHKALRDREFRKKVLGDNADLDYINHLVSDEDIEQTYYDRVAFVDKQLGLIIDQLKLKDLYDDSLIIITTDHGEAMGEHGSFGHGLVNQMHQGVIHSPLIMKAPNHNFAHQIDALVSSIDIFPTIIDMFNINVEYGKKQRPIGKSLVPLMRGDISHSHHEYIYVESRWPAEKDRSIAYVDNTGMKLIYGKTGIRELYNLNDDPNEETNLYPVSYNPFTRLLTRYLFSSIYDGLKIVVKSRGIRGYGSLSRAIYDLIKAITNYAKVKCMKDENSKEDCIRAEKLVSSVTDIEKQIRMNLSL
ncbi:MAG: sulfatase-like hydrolase/transferase, partial [Candidatus Scalindua sp.]|nr:sulfatase-like hydrolase/transferase [Candidatus Scalindua sp.]